jgi:hypothetical protein
MKKLPQPVYDYLNSILIAISKASKYTIEQLKSDYRGRHVVIARQVYCYKAFKNKPFDIAYAEIGSMINKDHSTVMYSIKCIKKFLSIKDPETLNLLSKFKLNGYSVYTISYHTINLKECIRNNTFIQLETYKEK